MRGMMKDTSIDKEKLINIVKQHEFVHNKDNPVYKNIMCMFHLYHFLFTAHIWWELIKDLLTYLKLSAQRRGRKMWTKYKNWRNYYFNFVLLTK